MISTYTLTHEDHHANAWGALYNAASRLVVQAGAAGEVSARSDSMSALMDALHALDGGTHIEGLTPHSAPESDTPRPPPQSKDEWIQRYVAHMVKASGGMDALAARDSAVASWDAIDDDDLFGERSDPERSADAEMAAWERDGDAHA